MKITKKYIYKDIIKTFQPQFHESSDYKNWIATLDLKTCLQCRTNHGKIYLIDEYIPNEPPLHPHCRCIIENLKAIYAGKATQDGFKGADYFLKQTGTLPNYYITKQHAKNLGWVSFLGNLNIVAPNKMIGGDVYRNKNGHLPNKNGRVWFEADINYDFGFRNNHRIIFSNDGLIFVTYDHYMTFAQIQ